MRELARKFHGKQQAMHSASLVQHVSSEQATDVQESSEQWASGRDGHL
jgi:hypothetical protein